MKSTFIFKPLFLALVLVTAAAHAAILDFENLQEGETLEAQYSSIGITFTPNAFSGAGGPTGDWATNTDMTITAIDVGDYGNPSLVSGKVLRSLDSGWSDEDGDPSFRISFADRVRSISADFAGVEKAADVRFTIYDDAEIVATVVGQGLPGLPRQLTLSFAGLSFTSVVVTPGSFDDWVAVDNIVYVSAVPEAGTGSILITGLGLLALPGSLRRLGSHARLTSTSRAAARTT